MKQILSFLVLFLSLTSLSYAVSLDDYIYEEDDIVGTIGNGNKQNIIVAKPEQAYQCESSGKYKPLKEGLLLVGTRPYGDYIYREGYDDVVKSSSYVSVYSKNEDIDVTSVIPFNSNYYAEEEIYFITYHSINPVVYEAKGKYSNNSITNFTNVGKDKVTTTNIGCYFIMAENQTSEYGIGYYWLYVTKSIIGKHAEVDITTKYLEDPSTLSRGTAADSDIYSEIRQHSYTVLQK